MKLSLIIFCFFAGLHVQAQVQLPVAKEIQKTFEKKTRSTTGKPGQFYWQNKATYTIDVSFNPFNRLLSGTCNIAYTNNSPDTLKEIVWKLYPNYYKKGVARTRNIEPQDAGEGIIINTLRRDYETVLEKNIRVNGTNMSVFIPPLLPGKSISFQVDYQYTLNESSHNRTGEVEKGAYFIAYFFPRITVYDDIDGWNRYPYSGSYEFYNDFSDFDVKYTLPHDYQVWSTGDLVNTKDIYTDKFQQRIHDAETKDALRFIIDSTDLIKGGITKSDSTHTWHFVAKNVTDVVFATSNHYIWQSSSIEVDKSTHRRTRVDAVFNPVHKDYFLVASDARKTVEAMSYEFPKWPFPYSHETVFDGLDQMEYPMMVNDNPVEDRAESIELTDHEIFHTMFPFYMGINETKYGWMDEGWATIGEWLISPMIDSSIVDEYGVEPYARAAGGELDAPIMTLTPALYGSAGFTNSYPKPAMGYLFVKDMLGDELFYKALHYYIRNWNGKHPMPYDFFYSMNAGAGKNMNWFWKRWFFDDGVPDLGLKVTGTGNTKTLTVSLMGSKPLPVNIEVKYKDGTMQTIHKSIAVWEKGNTSITIVLAAKKVIQQIEITHPHVPDANHKDNLWVAP
ncbi:MAG: M1 family metallopeptidase [Ferruginibacter sp.]